MTLVVSDDPTVRPFQEDVVMATIAYAHSFKNHLQDDDPMDEIGGLMLPAEAGLAPDPEQRPDRDPPPHRPSSRHRPDPRLDLAGGDGRAGGHAQRDDERPRRLRTDQEHAGPRDLRPPQRDHRDPVLPHPSLRPALNGGLAFAFSRFFSWPMRSTASTPWATRSRNALATIPTTFLWSATPRRSKRISAQILSEESLPPFEAGIDRPPLASEGTRG